jgi:hypothetical protein
MEFACLLSMLARPCEKSTTYELCAPQRVAYLHDKPEIIFLQNLPGGRFSICFGITFHVSYWKHTIWYRVLHSTALDQSFWTTLSRTGRVAAFNPTDRSRTDVGICCQIAEKAGEESLFGRRVALLVPPRFPLFCLCLVENRPPCFHPVRRRFGACSKRFGQQPPTSVRLGTRHIS